MCSADRGKSVSLPRIANTHMDSGYVSLDIETDSLLPPRFVDGLDAPPVVYCAATLEMRRTDLPGGYTLTPARAWPSAETVTEAGMTPRGIGELVDYLWEAWTVRGLRPLAWNGLGFDMRVIAAHIRDDPQALDRVRRLTLSMCDPMFTFFVHKGFPVGLNAVARAVTAHMGKSGHGSEVHEKWHTGHRARVGVLAYCCRDVELTAAVASSIERDGEFRWVTKAGKRARFKHPAGGHGVMATVEAADKVPRPDTSWMTTPIPKSDFIAWLVHPHPGGTTLTVPR